MGCITIEILIWLIYNYNAVTTFRKHTEHFWELQLAGGYVIHPYVNFLIKTMDQQLKDNTAYKELLQLARTKLLVVKIWKLPESVPGYREIAKVLLKDIKTIQQKCQGDNFESYLARVDLRYPSSEMEGSVPRQLAKVHQDEEGRLAAPEPKRYT